MYNLRSNQFGNHPHSEWNIRKGSFTPRNTIEKVVRDDSPLMPVKRSPTFFRSFDPKELRP